MKKMVAISVLCGLIFAGLASTCNAAPNWSRFKPKPIIVPPDTCSLNNNITIAGIDLRRFLPKPIVIPTDSAAVITDIKLSAKTTVPSRPLTPPLPPATRIHSVAAKTTVRVPVYTPPLPPINRICTSA